MWNYKIAMATFRTSQCQDGDALERRFRKPEHTKQHIKKDSNKYFVEKF